VAVNHERAQILAPLVIVDPWADLGAPAPGTPAPSATTGFDAPDAPAPARPAGDPAWPETDVPPTSRPPTEPIG
jgi:hypothetical protein